MQVIQPQPAFTFVECGKPCDNPFKNNKRSWSWEQPVATYVAKLLTNHPNSRILCQYMGGLFVFLIEPNQDSKWEAIGSMLITKQPNKQLDLIELMEIDENYRGNGYATRMIVAYEEQYDRRLLPRDVSYNLPFWTHFFKGENPNTCDRWLNDVRIDDDEDGLEGYSSLRTALEERSMWVEFIERQIYVRQQARAGKKVKPSKKPKILSNYFDEVIDDSSDDDSLDDKVYFDKKLKKPWANYFGADKVAGWYAK